MKKIDLSIIIVNYNTADLTVECIKSVYNHTKNINFEIILVDNNSIDKSVKRLNNKFKQKKNFVLVKSRENVGFAAGNNLGIKKTRGKYVLFLNSDTLLKNNLLPEMINWLEKNKKYGLISCALKNADNTFQHNGGYFPSLSTVFNWMFFLKYIPVLNLFTKPYHPKIGFYKKPHDLDWVTGAFMLFRSDVLKQVKGFDSDYFMYTEDVDLCFRVRKAGWKIKYLPNWEITHLGGSSSNKEFSLLSEFNGVKMFYKKHYPAWQMPLLRLFLKLGSFLRIFLISPKIYAKAFKTA